uniref:Uncharacterized protein n=1 Tax=Strongyloides stercoralis TaxID=6248 RepID=A0AAF5DKM5_STRER
NQRIKLMKLFCVYNPKYTKMLARVAYLNNRKTEASYVEGQKDKKITMTIAVRNKKSVVRKNAVKNIEHNHNAKSSLSMLRRNPFRSQPGYLKSKHSEKPNFGKNYFFLNSVELKKWLVEKILYFNTIWNNIKNKTIRKMLSAASYIFVAGNSEFGWGNLIKNSDFYQQNLTAHLYAQTTNKGIDSSTIDFLETEN